MPYKYVRKNTGNADETARHLNRFMEAMKGAISLPDPQQVIHIHRVLREMSREPSPADVFTNAKVPESLNNLWFAARIARERYLSALANEVLMKLPRIVDTAEGRAA